MSERHKSIWCIFEITALLLNCLKYLFKFLQKYIYCTKIINLKIFRIYMRMDHSHKLFRNQHFLLKGF